MTPVGTPQADRIPRVIHYCWFGDATMPPLIRRCMATWSAIMPDYELRRWDASSFDVRSVPFVDEAIRLRKWAFAADYVRLYALHQEGGIYLDTDVKVFRRFDPFLRYDFFSSHELHPVNFTAAERGKLDSNGRPVNGSDYVYGLNVLSAVMGSTRGNPFVADCLRFYEAGDLTFAGGRTDARTLIIGPFITKVAERYGYRYEPTEQHLAANMVIFPPEVFVGNSTFQTAESYASHLISGSWTDRSPYEQLKFWMRNHCPWVLPALTAGERGARLVARRFRARSASRSAVPLSEAQRDKVGSR